MKQDQDETPRVACPSLCSLLPGRMEIFENMSQNESCLPEVASIMYFVTARKYYYYKTIAITAFPQPIPFGYWCRHSLGPCCALMAGELRWKSCRLPGILTSLRLLAARWGKDIGRVRRPWLGLYTQKLPRR